MLSLCQVPLDMIILCPSVRLLELHPPASRNIDHASTIVFSLLLVLLLGELIPFHRTEILVRPVRIIIALIPIRLKPIVNRRVSGDSLETLGFRFLNSGIGRRRVGAFTCQDSSTGRRTRGVCNDGGSGV